MAAVWLTVRMQVRQSSVLGDRPQCPIDRAHRVHVHGEYRRYVQADGSSREKIPRWRCTVCGGTISVLPDTLLPYRSVGVALLEAWLDAAFMGRAPPEATERERGCLERALARYLQRTPSLSKVLGQMIETVKPRAAQLWEELRKLRKLSETLRFLADNFNTSLLGNYQCLHPWTVSC